MRHYKQLGLFSDVAMDSYSTNDGIFLLRKYLYLFYLKSVKRPLSAVALVCTEPAFP